MNINRHFPLIKTKSYDSASPDVVRFCALNIIRSEFSHRRLRLVWAQVILQLYVQYKTTFWSLPFARYVNLRSPLQYSSDSFSLLSINVVYHHKIYSSFPSNRGMHNIYAVYLWPRRSFNMVENAVFFSNSHHDRRQLIPTL